MVSWSLAKILTIVLVANVTFCASSDTQNDIRSNMDSAPSLENSVVIHREFKALHQLNCTMNSTICSIVCNETKPIPYSSTFCDSVTGSCVCDCRDSVPKSCTNTPFTPCFQDCVRKNPNPDVFLYEGVNCPIRKNNGTTFSQCACECAWRDDYEETNDII